MRVRLSSEARDFLIKEARYLRAHSSEAAQRLLARIDEAKGMLGRHAAVGPRVRASPVSGTRRLVLGDTSCSTKWIVKGSRYSPSGRVGWTRPRSRSRMISTTKSIPQSVTADRLDPHLLDGRLIPFADSMDQSGSSSLSSSSSVATLAGSVSSASSPLTCRVEPQRSRTALMSSSTKKRAASRP